VIKSYWHLSPHAEVVFRAWKAVRRCVNPARANAAGTLLSGTQRLRFRETPIYHHIGVSGYAEYAVVSRRSAIKVDKSLPALEAALFGCAVLTGVGAVINTAKMPAGCSVAVVGLGGVGLSALLAANQYARS
jgi:alcohol dehydrogenase